MLVARCTKRTRVLLQRSPTISSSAACSMLGFGVNNLVTRDLLTHSGSNHLVSVFGFGFGFGFAFVFDFGSDTDLPNEAEQFATNGGDDLRLVPSGSEQSSITSMQSMLSLPGDLFHFRSDGNLSSQQIARRARVCIDRPRPLPPTRVASEHCRSS
jgi:hypothetical protein